MMIIIITIMVLLESYYNSNYMDSSNTIGLWIISN